MGSTGTTSSDEDSDQSELPPGRPVALLTPEEVSVAIDEMLALIDQRLPERFYRGEGRWRPLAAGLIARMGDIVDSIRLLVPSRRQATR